MRGADAGKATRLEPLPAEGHNNDDCGDCYARLTLSQQLQSDDIAASTSDQDTPPGASGSPMQTASQQQQQLSLTSLTACLRAHNRYARRLSHHGGMDDPLLPQLDDATLQRIAAAIRVNEPRVDVFHAPTTQCARRPASA